MLLTIIRAQRMRERLAAKLSLLGNEFHNNCR